MLKRLLATTLVVMFVVGLSGIAKAVDIDNTCDAKIETEYVLRINLNEYWLQLELDNIVGVNQDGNGNSVDWVDQIGGSNLLTVFSRGSGNLVYDITQDNVTPTAGMNVLTIHQDGDNNNVSQIHQTQ